MRSLIVVLVVFLFVASAAGQQPDASTASTTAQPAPTAEVTFECHSCGVEILPQAKDYYDGDGNRICAGCAAKASPPEPFSLATTQWLTGDWGGARKEMADAGVNLGLTLGTVTQWNTHGGANTHNAFENTGEMGYDLEFDFGKILGLDGSTLFVRGVQTWGRSIAGDVGSLTPPFAGPGGGGDNEIVLHKYWWRQRLLDDRLEFRLGMLDGGDLVDGNAYASSAGGQFPNAALEHNPTIPLTTGLGLFVKAWPTDYFYAQALVADPDKDNDYNRRGTGGWRSGFHGEDRFRAFAEFGLLPHYMPCAEGSLLPGHYRFGLWLNPQGQTKFINDFGGRLRARSRSGDVGWYLSFDQMVWKENDAAKDKQGLGVFARYGFAHPDVNIVNHFWSAGLSYEGLIPERDGDVMGFGVAQSILSKTFRHNVNNLADRETVYDLYYKIDLTPWCKITPDLQWITHPSGQKSARDALTAGIRVEIVF